MPSDNFSRHLSCFHGAQLLDVFHFDTFCSCLQTNFLMSTLFVQRGLLSLLFALLMAVRAATASLFRVFSEADTPTIMSSSSLSLLLLLLLLLMLLLLPCRTDKDAMIVGTVFG